MFDTEWVLDGSLSIWRSHQASVRFQVLCPLDAYFSFEEVLGFLESVVAFQQEDSLSGMRVVPQTLNRNSKARMKVGRGREFGSCYGIM